MFSVRRMREPGSVSGVVGRGMLMGFGASGGPPARGVFLNFAHFGTAAVRVCFGARAIADRRRGALQRVRSVRQYWPAPGRQSHDAVERYESQSATQSRHPSRTERGAIHGQSLRPSQKKTDRTGRQKIAITRVLGPANAGTMRADSRLGPGREPNRNLAMYGKRSGVLEFRSNVRY